MNREKAIRQADVWRIGNKTQTDDLKDELIAALFERARLAAEHKSLREALQECVDAITASIPEDFSRLSNSADAGSYVLAKMKGE